MKRRGERNGEGDRRGKESGRSMEKERRRLTLRGIRNGAYRIGAIILGNWLNIYRTIKVLGFVFLSR